MVTIMIPVNTLINLSSYQYLLGTSRISILINVLLILFGLLLFYRFVLSYLICWALDILDYRRLRDRKLVFLELTPPNVNTKTLQATAQLYAGIHGLLGANSFRDRLLRHKKILPLEVVSTRAEGIRFIAALSPDEIEIFKQLVVSFMPSIRIREVEDYLTENITGKAQVLKFRQAAHFALPVAAPDDFNQHDPIAYITGAMTSPQPGELISLQIILSPAPRRVANKIRLQLLHGQETMKQRPWWQYPMVGLWKLLKIVFSIFGIILELIDGEVSGNRTSSSSTRYIRQDAAITPTTEHVLSSVHNKLDQPLFSANIRALIISPSNKQRARGLANSFHQFHVPGYQGFSIKRSFPRNITANYRKRTFTLRLPAILSSSSSVLAANEVAALYHFPYGDDSSAENLVKSLSKTLSAPLSMKRHADAADYDVMLGMNTHHGSKTIIGLTAKEREKHVYLVGGTGNGKTTMMEYAILQDIISGKGVAFIDPHGDAAQKLLRYIPKHRINDVVYLNPIDIKYPIGINLLELPDGLDEDDLLIEKERITEAVISVFRKVFSDDDASAHRIEAMFRNAIQTAFTVPDATLFTVLKLFRNTEFRNQVISKLTDEHLIDFWREEFGKAGGMQRVSMSKGATLRIDRFRSSAPASRMLDQIKSTISFEDIIDSGKILICNFSQDMGEDTSTLFGTTVLARLKIAAERRSKQPEANRKPFYVYVDEFQNFATTPFVKMLSASRKYKLFLTLAEQSTAQQEEQRLTEAILANVSTLICFGLGSPADEHLLLQRFVPYLEKGELTNLPSYSFYARVKAGEPMEPVSGKTIVLESNENGLERAEAVIAASRTNYTKKYVKPLKAAPSQTVQIQKPDHKKKQSKAVIKRSLKHIKSNN